MRRVERQVEAGKVYSSEQKMNSVLALMLQGWQNQIHNNFIMFLGG